MRKLLHAGCGPKGGQLPTDYRGYKEVRLDNDSTLDPDILASIIAMPMVQDGEYDAILCSHTLEHLYAHEVPMALREFERVLIPGGVLELRVPDIQAIGGRLALGEADKTAYQSSMGPITPLDMLYGHQGSIAKGALGMAHKTGFTESLLRKILQATGFAKCSVERVSGMELKALAIKEVETATIAPAVEALAG